MILLNMIYGLIMAIVYVAVSYFFIPTETWLAVWWKVGGTIWLTWSLGHVIYDFIAHLTVKFFNRNAVFKG